MHKGSLIVAQPQVSDQLVLMFHGVGASAQDLAPLGQALVHVQPRATLISVEAPQPSQLGSGKEWFSVVGITEEQRAARIAEAMPVFLQTIAHWQDFSGIAPQRTVLLGFSQGAIMALESTQTTQQPTPAAQTVISLAGRFAGPVRRAPPDVRFHLIHGESDAVLLPSWSIEAD